MAKTSASFTIMDYTDGVSLITGIDSNLPFTCLYDSEAIDKKLNPSWVTKTDTNGCNGPLVLTPKVMKAGSSTSLVEDMDNVIWYRRLSGEQWKAVSSSNGEAVSSKETGYKLNVSRDQLLNTVWQIEYKFTGTYTDPILGIAFDVEAVATFSRVANGTSFVVARAYAPNGSTFKNKSDPPSLKVIAELIRKTGKDTTGVSYTWQYSTNGTGWDAVSKLPEGSVSVNEGELTVYPDAVNGFTLFRCIIEDTDSTSDTYQNKYTSEGISIYDVTDPFQAVIESTAGSFFKKSSSTSESSTKTTLICRVYQNGEEYDTTGAKLTYTWSQTDKDGNAKTLTVKPVAIASEGIVATNNKAIEVTPDMVTVKSTFFCEVS